MRSRRLRLQPPSKPGQPMAVLLMRPPAAQALPMALQQRQQRRQRQQGRRGGGVGGCRARRQRRNRISCSQQARRVQMGCLVARQA